MPRPPLVPAALALLVPVLGLLLLAGLVGPAAAPSVGAGDPRASRGLFVDPYMPGSKAAAQDSRYARIGRSAQPLWITDYYGVDDVRGAVRRYVQRAEDAGKTPLLVIYAIPGRDCGLYSSGGLPDAASYRRWVSRAAAGLRGSHPLVIVEPDAVPFIGNERCRFDVDERLSLLRYALSHLTRAGAWAYLDAGHSGWRTPAQMAPLLKRAGIGSARGFSTDVGNFRPTADEQRYARALVAALARQGVSGRRYVIDTGRNGASRPVDGDVCNPTWARLGEPPRLVLRGSFDGRLWVKNPGESDGQSSDDTCHGGPPSGQWWPQGARRLLQPR